jgi:malate/lactate dehydrogenase
LEVSTLKIEDLRKIGFGDVLKTDYGYRLVVKDSLYKEVRLVDLIDGKIKGTLDDLEQVMKFYRSCEIIKADRLKLVIE